MSSSCRPDTDIPDWLRSLLAVAWTHRATVGPVAALVVAFAVLSGVTYYRFGPTDIDRAEADVKKGRAVVDALLAEADGLLHEASAHRTRAAEYQKLADENKDTLDAEGLELQRATAASHSQRGHAKRARRDTLVHLAAEYRRLVAEAECEVFRAKDARDRGTPYPVAPRVRELLAPILSAH